MSPQATYHTQRNRSSSAASLSISRSPSILSSGPANPFTFPNHPNHPIHSSHPSHSAHIHGNGHGHDIESTLLPPRKSSLPIIFNNKPFSPDNYPLERIDSLTESGSDLAQSDADLGSSEETTYTGGFQEPKGRELLMMILAFGGVMVLSIAAGLTTIYDWVL